MVTYTTKKTAVYCSGWTLPCLVQLCFTSSAKLSVWMFDGVHLLIKYYLFTWPADVCFIMSYWAPCVRWKTWVDIGAYIILAVDGSIKPWFSKEVKCWTEKINIKTKTKMLLNLGISWALCSLSSLNYCIILLIWIKGSVLLSKKYLSTIIRFSLYWIKSQYIYFR